MLGPIAFQPGEYRISQCPVCRRETSPNIESSELTSNSKGFITRFLHTYFPQDEGEDAFDKADEEEDMQEIIAILVKAAMVDNPVESVQSAVAKEPAQKLQWLQRDPLAIDGNMTMCASAGLICHNVHFVKNSCHSLGFFQKITHVWNAVFASSPTTSTSQSSPVVQAKVLAVTHYINLHQDRCMVPMGFS